METKPGKFIVFEGLDGAGQSTQVSLLAKRLQKEGHKILLTKEPTNNLVGGLIRGALTHEWKPTNRIIQLLYAADRGHHLQREILPALEKGFTVICDRYFYSTIAFGSIDMEISWLKTINEPYPEPDLAFYIKVRPQTSMARMQGSRFELELFEKERELGLVAKTYDQLVAENPVLQSIDGERGIEEIHEEIYQSCLKLWK